MYEQMQPQRKPASRVKVLAFMAALAWRARDNVRSESYLAELLTVLVCRG